MGVDNIAFVIGLDMGLSESDAAVVQDELGDRGAVRGTREHLGGAAHDKLGVAVDGSPSRPMGRPDVRA
ncbi:hypothetical protein [Streptomyces sp. NPDC001604]|uniref:hypothetical protein n=1 Tax=Streptomyces sp. NPDC001604 TaxID=3364593 RepID=UPI0036C2277A